MEIYRFLLLLSVCTIPFLINGQQTTTDEDPNVLTFTLDSLISRNVSGNKRWLPFLKGKNVLTGLYRLKVGEEDLQKPHDTDEVYYIVEGKATFVTAEEHIGVGKGSILFVKALVAHKFIEIEEDLTVLVFFDQ